MSLSKMILMACSASKSAFSKQAQRLATVSLNDVPLTERRKAANTPLFISRV
jgi:hypothetical protein